MADTNVPNVLELAHSLVTVWLANPNTNANHAEAAAFLRSVHGAICDLAGGSEPSISQADIEFGPAVSVKKSLASKDHIISLIDGKPYKALKRHLSRHGLTPDEYRHKFGLRPDYPMVAENYSKARRELADRVWEERKAIDVSPLAAPQMLKDANSVKPKSMNRTRRGKA